MMKTKITRNGIWDDLEQAGLRMKTDYLKWGSDPTPPRPLCVARSNVWIKDGSQKKLSKTK